MLSFYSFKNYSLQNYAHWYIQISNVQMHVFCDKKFKNLFNEIRYHFNKKGFKQPSTEMMLFFASYIC